MVFLWALTVALLILSAVKDKDKTKEALKVAFKRFAQLLDEFLVLLVLASLALALFPPERIRELLKGSGLLFGSVIAAVVGSITFVPGFVAYPMAGILKKEGIPVTVLASLLVTMMMVGVLTLPLESRLFGKRFAVVRNATYFVIAILVSLAIGLAFGELP